MLIIINPLPNTINVYILMNKRFQAFYYAVFQFNLSIYVRKTNKTIVIRVQTNGASCLKFFFSYKKSGSGIWKY